MCDYEDDMRLKNTLSHEVRVTQHVLTFCTKFIVDNFTDFLRFFRSISVKSIVVVMSQMRDATRNLAIATMMRKSFATNFDSRLHPRLS